MTMKTRSSWLEKSMSEKLDNNVVEKLLYAFWSERVEKKQKTYKIESFKNFLLCCYQEKAYEIEKAFDALVKYNKNSFIEILKNILTPEDAIAVDKVNKFGVTHQKEVKVTKISDKCVNDFKQYMDEKRISAVAAVGNAESKLFVTVSSKDTNSSALYAMHSVAKLFTSVLLLKLIADKILDGTVLKTPIKELLESSTWNALPNAIQEHLDKHQISLYQLMLHEGAIKDFIPQYRNALYMSVTNKTSIPKIDNVEDFLKYADHDPVPQFLGKNYYSNLGITLVGLAIEEACKKIFPKRHLNFYEILNITILKPADIDKHNFLIDGTLQKERCRFNKDDPTALYLAGGPAGGYWTTIDDLKKFMVWLYDECQKKEFMSLVKVYGQEFYNDKTQVIEHAGHMSCYNANTQAGASAVISLDLQTGNTFVAMSDQSTGTAIDLDPVVRRNIFVLSGEELNETTLNPCHTTIKPSYRF